jgi:hypothetical protein
MAQTERNPKANSFTDNTPITALRTSIQPGNVINFADIESVINLTNGWLGHFHTYDDAYQLATYGNNGDRGNYYDPDKNTVTIGAAMTNITAEETITATKVNELRGNINLLGNHNHDVDDRTG